MRPRTRNAREICAASRRHWDVPLRGTHTFLRKALRAGRSPGRAERVCARCGAGGGSPAKAACRRAGGERERCWSGRRSGGSVAERATDGRTRSGRGRRARRDAVRGVTAFRGTPGVGIHIWLCARVTPRVTLARIGNMVSFLTGSAFEVGSSPAEKGRPPQRGSEIFDDLPWIRVFHEQDGDASFRVSG